MRKFIILFTLVILASNAFSQEYIKSSFYRSFAKHFIVRPVAKYYGYNGFHSILLTTNGKGQIVSYIPSESMSTDIKNDVRRAFEKADKDGLMDFKLINRQVYLPIMILSTGLPDSHTEDMWRFSSPANEIVKILPPLIYILPKGQPVYN